MSPILVHFHFHNRRTGVTRSIENVLPGLQQMFETSIFGYGIEGPKIGLGKLLKLIFSRTYFVLHAHRVNEMIAALLLRVLGGKFKLVATRHAESEPKKFTLYLLRKADEVITLTRSMAALLPMPSTVIGHGIDTRFFVPGLIQGFDGVTQKKIISVIGRVRETKGQRIFLEAVAPVLKKNAEWAAVIVGKIDNDSFLNGLQSIINSNQVENQVYFFDETKDILKFYQGSSIVVVPSFTEGFSLVCLEAMACGCVVVATDQVGVHPDIIKHGQSGFLFPPGDAQKLQTILDAIASGNQPDTREKAMEIVRANWDVSKESENLAALYLK